MVRNVKKDISFIHRRENMIRLRTEIIGTQEDMVRLLDTKCGLKISRGFYGKIERGYDCKNSYLQDIANVLGVNVESIS